MSPTVTIILSTIVSALIGALVAILIPAPQKLTFRIGVFVVVLIAVLAVILAWLNPFPEPDVEATATPPAAGGEIAMLVAQIQTLMARTPEPDNSGTIIALQLTLEALQNSEPAIVNTTPFPPANETPTLVVPAGPAAPLPPNPTAGARFVRVADQMPMVFVPGGSFTMGGVADQYTEQNELPQFTARVEGFWMDLTEVTNLQYATFLNANLTFLSPTWLDLAAEESQIERVDGVFRPAPNYEAHPVIDVTWYGADAYCRWSGGRLPDETEWEYAARGVDGRIYPWGNTFDATRLNYCDVNCPRDYASSFNDGYARTASVGSVPNGASWIGVLDMAGNVAEWTAFGLEAYPLPPSYDGFHKVLRGGSWVNTFVHARTTHRNYPNPADSADFVGFRCVMSQ